MPGRRWHLLLQTTKPDSAISSVFHKQIEVSLLLWLDMPVMRPQLLADPFWSAVCSVNVLMMAFPASLFASDASKLNITAHAFLNLD